MKLIIMLLAGLFSVVSVGGACDSGWEYIGQAPWPPLSATFYPNSADTMLVGTLWNTTIPPSGGVYRHIGSGTTLEYAGLIGRSAYALRNFPYYRPDAVFAATSHGLYRFTGDTTWALLHSGEWWRDFDVSPLDTNLWVAVTNYFGQGAVLVTEDGGAHWYAFFEAFPRGHLACSRYHSGQAFFADAAGLVAISVYDSTLQTIISFSPSAPDAVFYHPTEPWIYAVSGHRIGRFDEATGDTMTVGAPDSVTNLRNGSYDMGNHALVVSTSSGLYLVNDDLSSWRPVQSDPPAPPWWWLLSVGDSGCIANSGDDGVFAARPTPDLAGPPSHPDRQRPSLVLYPNPTAGVLQLDIRVRGNFEIFNVLGQRVHWFATPPGLSSIDLSQAGLSTGTYFYQYHPAVTKSTAVTGTLQLIR